MRTLSESLKELSLSDFELKLLPVLEKLQLDSDAGLRQALVEQMPAFGKWLLAFGTQETYHLLLLRLVPMLTELTTDTNQQVSEGEDGLLDFQSLIEIVFLKKRFEMPLLLLWWQLDQWLRSRI